MKILLKQKSAYALSLVLLLLGISAVLFTVWKTYPQISSSSSPFSTFFSLLWTESMTLFAGFEFKLIFLFILGDAMLIASVIVWVLSRQWLVIPGRAVWFQCPFCKKKWRATEDKALTHCPHCNQLIHPRMTEK